VSSHKSNSPTQSASRYAGLRAVNRTGALSFGQVAGDTLRECVTTVVAAGDAILFGRTSDGGALSVRILSNGVTECWYPSDASELQELLEAVTALNKA
jgi:hypothetical protein